MNLAHRFRLPIILTLAAIVTACASTNPVGEWRDANYSGKVDRVYIIGATSSNDRRRLFEDSFVAALNELGVGAEASYKSIARNKDISRETVTEAIAGTGIDAVLVTRMIGIAQTEVYKLPAAHDHHRSYDHYHDYALAQSNPGYFKQYNLLTLETNLYDVTSGELVWSMQSELMDKPQPDYLIRKQIDLTIRTLSRQGIIQPE